MPRSIAAASLKLAGLYEAELLVELMLRYWQHPLADDSDFRGNLLETAVAALDGAAKGQRLLQNLPARQTNLVAAIWYSEWAAISTEASAAGDQIRALREKWLDSVRRALPSCFCDPELLT